MDRDALEAGSVAALARAVGLAVPAEDLEPLAEALRRYAEVAAVLEAADLDGIEPDPSLDPRLGW